MPALRLLVVEDDADLRSLLRRGLTEEGFEVATAADGASALTAAEAGPDALVIDVGLPDSDGRDVCQALRARGTLAPVLFLTARDAVADRLAGFSAGGDDYLTKPFAFDELVARLRALARRQPAIAPQQYDIADLHVDLATHTVRRGGTEITLTAKEFALLEFLVQHAGEVVTRTAITAYVWDENHDPFTNVLEVLVRRLRRKIDDPFEPKLIHTLRGAGYRLGA